MLASQDFGTKEKSGNNNSVPSRNSVPPCDTLQEFSIAKAQRNAKGAEEDTDFLTTEDTESRKSKPKNFTTNQSNLLFEIFILDPGNLC